MGEDAEGRWSVGVSLVFPGAFAGIGWGGDSLCFVIILETGVFTVTDETSCHFFLCFPFFMSKTTETTDIEEAQLGGDHKQNQHDKVCTSWSFKTKKTSK